MIYNKDFFDKYKPYFDKLQEDISKEKSKPDGNLVKIVQSFISDFSKVLSKDNNENYVMTIPNFAHVYEMFNNYNGKEESLNPLRPFSPEEDREDRAVDF